MKSTTKAKMKYNREVYKRYEFNVRKGTVLNSLIERYKENPEKSFSELIKSCLCQHFGLHKEEADLIYSPYFLGKNGEHIPNDMLDEYFPKK